MQVHLKLDKSVGLFELDQLRRGDILQKIYKDFINV